MIKICFIIIIIFKFPYHIKHYLEGKNKIKYRGRGSFNIKRRRFMTVTPFRRFITVLVRLNLQFKTTTTTNLVILRLIRSRRSSQVTGGVTSGHPKMLTLVRRAASSLCLRFLHNQCNLERIGSHRLHTSGLYGFDLLKTPKGFQRFVDEAIER